MTAPSPFLTSCLRRLRRLQMPKYDKKLLDPAEALLGNTL